MTKIKKRATWQMPSSEIRKLIAFGSPIVLSILFAYYTVNSLRKIFPFISYANFSTLSFSLLPVRADTYVHLVILFAENIARLKTIADIALNT